MTNPIDCEPIDLLGDAVLGVGQHCCHWPGCDVHVSPKMWGCKDHWLRLPNKLRIKLWAAYRPGQEIDKAPSPAYIEAAKNIQWWIAENANR